MADTCLTCGVTIADDARDDLCTLCRNAEQGAPTPIDPAADELMVQLELTKTWCELKQIVSNKILRLSEFDPDKRRLTAFMAEQWPSHVPTCAVDERDETIAKLRAEVRRLEHLLTIPTK